MWQAIVRLSISTRTRFTGAQQVAFKQAAVETIRRGYDRFMIMNGQTGSSYVGSTPVAYQSLGRGAGMVYGGAPMMSHDQGLTVKLFRENEPGFGNAISARDTLGPDGKAISEKDTLSCL